MDAKHRPKYRACLPLEADKVFIMDGGLETTLIFEQNVDLPLFASFTLLDSEEGRATLGGYYARYAALARDHGVGFVLETPTWRANADWGAQLGFDAARLDALNRRAIELVADIRDRFETDASPMVLNGVLGPRGDGYEVGQMMSTADAADYHAPQVRSFAASAADLVGAFTLTYAEEAAGIALAARAAGIPSVISFTVETDGRLPSGQSLREAIEQVDAETDAAPAFFMVNCAHPLHVEPALAGGGDWLARIRGFEGNASTLSHAELNASPTLDPGDPVDFGRRYRSLRERMKQLTVLGGCCGTSYAHIEQICLACLPEQA
ncbi:homocysteine S-methyltransferase family protein [Ancylobacter sp. Lp-2]|uniref:homocysteine S-methyltransferase family protein n=1 Tax=Ancylobacter sp. Lp-2 TaxID=2881339 RepID=UPI001E49120D|nr:homocysteine S-methyltransferase family protein [Ancylobacter sp. Lp-2]MCB4771782.1 homocysteine S-methyltransferase family protein [Ancylobacter sp. Lp-2]